ncbi:MAG: alpha/beta fold hydrolase [Bacteroidia bacterium]
MKKWKIFSITFFLVYLLFAQSCLRMRTNDKDAIGQYNKLGINLRFNDFILDDLKIHFAKTGNDTASTIFFIHGSPGSWSAYENFLSDSNLIKKYRLISVDRPGFGYSNFNEPQNLQTQTNVLNKFINSIDNKKNIYVIGHSYGGPLVANMASENQKINGIIIIAGAISLKLEKPEKWRKLFINNPLESLVPGALNSSNHELWWLKNDLNILEKKLTNIKCKTIVIHGTKDQLVSFGNLKFIQEQFTSVDTLKTIILKDVNHFIPWNNFDLVKKELLNLE